MGLDQWVYARGNKVEDIDDQSRSEKDQEVQYWRKHPNMHGWMESLYREKGGTGDFNCTTVKITSEDLDQLQKDIEVGALPETSGFFFGKSDGSEQEKDLAFVSRARGYLAQGYELYYYSWW